VRVFDARLERFFHVVCADLDGVTRVTKVGAGGVAIWGHNMEVAGLRSFIAQRPCGLPGYACEPSKAHYVHP